MYAREHRPLIQVIQVTPEADYTDFQVGTGRTISNLYLASGELSHAEINNSNEAWQSSRVVMPGDWILRHENNRLEGMGASRFEKMYEVCDDVQDSSDCKLDEAADEKMDPEKYWHREQELRRAIFTALGGTIYAPENSTSIGEELLARIQQLDKFIDNG